MQNLSRSDYEYFLRLSANKDFIHWKKVVDDFQIERAFSLIAGTMEQGVSEIDILKDFRGGYKLWKKVISLIESADTMIAEIDKEYEEPEKVGISLLGEEVEEVGDESEDDISRTNIL